MKKSSNGKTLDGTTGGVPYTCHKLGAIHRIGTLEETLAHIKRLQVRILPSPKPYFYT